MIELLNLRDLLFWSSGFLDLGIVVMVIGWFINLFKRDFK